jgi:hypothetical protein
VANPLCINKSKELGYLSHYSYKAVGRMTTVQFSAGSVKGFFSLYCCVQTNSEAHPASYPVWLPWAVSLEVKQFGCEAVDSPPCSLSLRMCGAMIPLLNTSS